MGRYVGEPAAPVGLDEEYRAARLCRVLSMRLVAPATDDDATHARCRDALAVANRKKGPARLDALEVAVASVFGDQAVERARALVVAESLPDAGRMSQYVDASA